MCARVIRIESYKYGQRLHRVWERTKVLAVEGGQEESSLIGFNFHTRVWEPNGKVWVTQEPAICYFSTRHWFNVIWFPWNGSCSYYCNAASPYRWRNEEVLCYTDFDLDLLVDPDGKWRWVDGEEFRQNQAELHYPVKTVERIWEEAAVLEEWKRAGRGPFSPGFRERWYRYITEHRLLEN